MLILNQDEVYKSLPMKEAIAAMRWAYEAWSTGQVIMPPRNHLDMPEKQGVCLFMPASVPGQPGGGIAPSLVVKAVSVFPENEKQGLAAIQGAVLVLEPSSGRCLALLEGASLTAIRTGAGSGVATEALARREASTAALIGAGAQSRTQLQAICEVRSIETVWIYTRTQSKAVQLREKMAGIGRIPGDIRIVPTAREAVRNADIVCTATTSYKPLFEEEDLKPGAHINAIGAFRREMQEIPPGTVRRSRLYVDNRASALAEAGDLILSIEAGWIDATHILGEIGEVLCGRAAGRQSADDLTLFKSVGMAAQDAAAAMAAYTFARDNGIGQYVRWTDERM
jgi:ornithine cyclodeaminase/alanine dehydrogenase-like protein (mu-crystallin family)